MATALAAVRLQRPQQPDGVDAVHRYMEVVHGMRELGTSRVRVRALAAFGKRVSSESRESVCRVPLFRISSPRREALVSAMGEGEHDITDMQETDKVSGEWWKNVLTAVQDWSSDKLLGLAELADGSLFFSFGGSESARPAAKTLRAQTEAKVNGSTHNTTPVTRPPRQPSSFRKHSPIPASRKKSATVSTEAPATGPEDKKTQKTRSPSKSARPQRPPSAFSKRSPIPKDRVRVPASTSEKKTPPEVPPVADTPTPTPAFDSQTDSPFSSELKEILNHGKETRSEDTVKSKTDSKASSAAPAKKKPKEILNHGKETQSEEDTVESKTDAKTSSPAPTKKKPSKAATEESKPAAEESKLATEVSEVAQNGAATEDLGNYKLPELRSLAKARGLKGYSKLKKGELVELLASSQP